LNVGKISVKDAQRVKLSDMMTAHLICTNEKLNLQMIVEFGTTTAGMQGRGTIGWRGNEARRWLESSRAR
jgi:hypothetical protein